MGKGNFLTNNVSGKIGAMVFMRRKGQQVTRSWVKPADKGTTKQGAQRSKLYNLVATYRASRDFFQLAFENKKSSQSDYNALVSRNISREPSISLPKSFRENGAGVVAPYVISDGSLQPILVTGKGVDATTNIAIGESFEISEATTIGDLTAAILANNTFILEGDQLSYLSIEQYNEDGYPRLRSRKYEIVLSLSDSTALLSKMPVQAVANKGGWLAHGDLVYSGAFAWVLSRNSAGKIQVSRQSLIVTSESLYNSYTGVDAVSRANISYGWDKEIFIDPSATRGGASVVPSAAPSIAVVRYNDSQLDSSTESAVSVAAGKIASGSVDIQGSSLSGVETFMATIVLIIVDELTDAQTEQSINIAMPVTASSDTHASNNSELSLVSLSSGTTAKMKSLVLKYGNKVVFSWSAKS